MKGNRKALDGMNRWIFILIIALQVSLVTAQKIISIPGDAGFTQVTGIPNSSPHKNANGYEFIDLYTDTFYFGYRISEKEFKTIGGPIAADFFYNSAKSDARFANDTITLWTQYPFRASEVVYRFLFKGKKLKLINTDAYDPSAAFLELAEKALAEGYIQEAIEYYYSVQYPSSYYSESDVAMRLISKANDRATILIKIDLYKKAVEIFNSALEYYMVPTIMQVTMPGDENDWFTQHYMEEYRDSFGLWMTNYGYVLYKADSFEQSIEINTQMNMMYPELPDPFLYRADALYDWGKQKESQEFYLKYYLMMYNESRRTEIPQRVLDRLTQ